MALQYSPKIVTDSLVMCLDASQNKSYPTTDLPVKGGLALWLDAADDSTFSYSSGTSVSQWRDKSGNNRHFFQATAGNQPSRSAVVNSRKAIQFTAASSQYLRYNSKIINNTTGGSVFVAWRTAGETGAYSSILDNYHCGSNVLGAGFQIERNATNNQYYWGFVTPGCGNGGFMPATSYSNDTTNCIWITKDSTTITGGLNGTSGTPNASPSSTWVEDDKGWTIGAWGSGTESFARFFNGIECEVIIFNRGLSPTEVKQVNTYLGQKWGILNTDKSIVDISGGSYVGLLGNGTTSTMPVYDFYNKGTLKFDGTDDYVVGTVPSIAASSTVGMWIKSANYGGKIPFSIAGSTYGSGPNIFFYNNLINWNTGDGSSNPFSNSSYPDSNWHYMVVTNDAATNAKLYIDGVLIGTAAYRNTISTNSNNLWLGRFSGDNNYTINGNIAGTQIYNRVLSAVEVLQNYEAQKSKFANTIVQQGLVLNLDAGNPYSYAGAGSAWYDVSGNNLIFNSQGATQTPFTTIGGSPCFDFNGSGYWECGTNFNLVDLGGDCTIIMWFYCETMAERRTIFEKAGTSYASYQQEIAVTWETGNDFSYYSRYSPDYDYANTIANTVNAWNMVGIKMSTGKTSAARTGFYSKNGSAWQSAYTSRSNVALVAAGAIRVGHGYAGTVTNGYISSVLCYNRLLTDAEILQNYNATKGRFGL